VTAFTAYLPLAYRPACHHISLPGLLPNICHYSLRTLPFIPRRLNVPFAYTVIPGHLTLYATVRTGRYDAVVLRSRCLTPLQPSTRERG